MARQNRLLTCPEAKFLAVDPLATPNFRSDVGSDGNGLTNPQNWIEHQADGYNLAQETVLVGEEARVSRNFMPRYRHMEEVLRGTTGLPKTDVLIEGNTRRRITFTDVEYGSPAIETTTGYYGIEGNAVRLSGGKVNAFNIDGRRTSDGGNVSGQIEYHFNRLFPGIVIPGTQAHNAKYRFRGADALSDGVFNVGVYTVTPTGARHYASGTGNALTVYGIDVFSKTIATLQTAIRAIDAAHSTAVVTGTITQAANGTGFRATGAGLAVCNVDYTFTGNNYTNPNGCQIFAGNGGWTMTDQTGSATYLATGATAEPPLTGWTVVGQGIAPAPTLSVVGGTAASATLTVTYDAAAGNIADLVFAGAGYTGSSDQYSAGGGFASNLVTLAKTDTAAQIKTKFETLPNVTTVNVSAAATAESFDVEFVSPANTRVTIKRISGINWSVAQMALGSSGEETEFATGPYLEPDHFRAYIALNEADLASINIYDLPDDEGEGGDPHLLEKANAVTFSMADMWKLHYAANTKRFATDFVSGARTVTAGVVVPNEQAEGTDCDFLLKTQEGCVSTGFWLKIVYTCGGFEFIIDLFCGRNQPVGYEVDNDVWLRNFPLARRRNPEGLGSLRFTLTTPVL